MFSRCPVCPNTPGPEAATVARYGHCTTHLYQLWWRAAIVYGLPPPLGFPYGPPSIVPVRDFDPRVHDLELFVGVTHCPVINSRDPRARLPVLFRPDIPPFCDELIGWERRRECSPDRWSRAASEATSDRDEFNLVDDGSS